MIMKKKRKNLYNPREAHPESKSSWEK